MIFVDTGAWFAALIPTDPDHARCERMAIGKSFAPTDNRLCN